MVPENKNSQKKTLSIQSTFLLFCFVVGFIVLSILSFIFLDAFKSYRSSQELSVVNQLLIETRTLNYGLSDEIIEATRYMFALNEGGKEESGADATQPLPDLKKKWLVIHDRNLIAFSDMTLRIKALIPDSKNNASLKQLAAAKKILIDIGGLLSTGSNIHPDTLLESYTAIFKTLDVVRTELLEPQDAGQFALHQSLLIERLVQSLYDITVTEGVLLTRIINANGAADEQLLNRLTFWREEASKKREYMDMYLEKIFSGKGFYEGQKFHSLQTAIEEMQERFEGLDDVRRKIYTSSFLNVESEITVGQWQIILKDALESIKLVESIIVLPAERAVQKDVDIKTRQIEFVFLSSIMALIVLSALFYFLRQNVLKPVVNVTNQMTALAAGEIQVKMPALKRQDEIARMVSALETFKDTAMEAKRLASFPEKNPDPIIELNENGIVTYMNPVARKEFPDMSVDATTHVLFNDFVDLQIESLSHSTVIVHEKEIQNKFYERYTTFVKLQEKILVRVFLRDITKRKEKERDLRETQEKAEILLKALETSKTGIVILDIKQENRPVEYVNDSFLSLTGYQRSELIGKGYNVWFNDNVQNQIKSDIENIMKTEGHLTKEIELPRADGSVFWVRIRLAPVRRDEHRSTAYIFIVNDIAEERKKKELEKNQQNMVSIAKMAGGMAHEINNALQPILGLSEAMMKKYEAEEQYAEDRELAKVIYDYSDYARNIVHDMLSFTKQDASKAEKLDAIEVLKEAVSFVEETVPKGVSLKTSGLGYDADPETPLSIVVNKTGLFQIFTNLIKNACHAMDDKGEVDICVQLDRLGVNNTRGLISGNYIAVSLRDSGGGMDKETKAKLFEPFFSTKDVGKGTGLGLSVVYGIIKNWNGDIFVESALNKGTTFYIYLPVVE